MTFTNEFLRNDFVWSFKNLKNIFATNVPVTRIPLRRPKKVKWNRKDILRERSTHLKEEQKDEATGAFYYSRRLKNHNLTVTEINNMNTYSFLWNENEAEKASCEVATSVLKFLEIKRAKGKQCINLLSDRCDWSQNQNRMVFIMLSNAITDLKLKKTELTFLVPGHSQNETDTAHSVIESHYRNRFVYKPNQWESTIQQAFKSKCVVTVLFHNDIIDFKNVAYFPQHLIVLADKWRS